MHKAFLNIHDFLKNRKIFGFSVLLFYIAITAFFAWNITLEEDITKLIPSGEKQDILKKVLRVTDLSDKLIISISAGSEDTSPDTLVAYANDLTGRIEKELPGYVNEIKGKVPEKDIRQVYKFVYDNLPVFLQEKDYEKISNRLYPDSIRPRLGSGYRQLMSPTGFVTKDYFLSDPLSFTNLGLSKLQELQVGDNFGIYKNYLITKDRKNIILFLDSALPSSETDRNEDFINSLEDITGQLNQEYDQVEASYFGGILYSLANADRIKKDIRLTIGIAVVLLLILLIFFYRKIYVPFLLFIPSILAGITAIAVLSIAKGSVSAISLGIGAILLGITLDYALHILTHYRNNRNITQLYRDITRPILMSSTTTAVAFLCLIFVQSEALNDLGIFASISVLLSSIFALVLIPLFYKPKPDSTKNRTFLDKIAAVDYSAKRPLVVVVLLLFIVSLFFFNRVEFNNDLSKLNFEPPEIKKLENRVEGLAGRSGKTIYMVAYGNSVDDALQENNKLYQRLQDLENEGRIENFSSIGGVILSTETQNNRIETWESFWTPEKTDSLRENIISISAEYGFRPETFHTFYQQLQKDFSNIDLDDYKHAGSLYLDDFISEDEDIATVTSTVSLEEGNSADFIANFKNENGIFALDRKAINQNFLGSLKEDFNKLILISILAVFVILLISYRNLEISLFTLLPIAVTWICALGIMAILDIEFNILNIIISTFIFGLGLDYSIFITNACLHEYETGRSDLKTYQTSILISVITTLLGMGALIFAQHPALRSVSIVSIIGVLTAVFVSFVLQRAIFKKLILNRVEKGKAPFHFGQLADFRGRISESESEKLYRKLAILDNYRYKSVFPKVSQRFKSTREKNLRVSRYIEDGESISIVNSEYGIIPLFLSYKFRNASIHAYENKEYRFRVSKRTPRSNSAEIFFYSRIEDLPSSKVFIINGDFSDQQELINLIKENAEKVIFIDSEFPNRWLLDMNFEIVYRQNNILVFRKAD
ncbi:MMPL family transporter [Gramella jeungdoensis]|uniref:MMPL family transporter n=1 Tax=Gramella jeungdoensis TaxID=708091 RepID=A0ABT0Z2V4_9FLAO|nr:MMPL family transporter [Gramella jeungdoensis]MCM8570052.1 MMPL family transporter [Gramella jeungdoensis]